MPVKVKLKQHYQDAQVHYIPDQIVDVSVSLGEYLLFHRMAEKVEEEPVKVQEPVQVEPIAPEIVERPFRRARRQHD